MNSHRPDGVNINIRKVNFTFENTLPVNWFPTNSAVQLLCDVTSLLFPAGERFFIDSVKHYRSHITDPELQNDVAAFIAQESMHTQQHLECNDILKSHSKYAGLFEIIPKTILEIVRILLPARTKLAVTCALEHFTALFSDQLLRNPIFHQYANPTYAKLWMWHAIEESEHKAVCFDVYQLFCGGIIGYMERCIVMIMTSLIFFAVIIIGFIAALLLNLASGKAVPNANYTPPQRFSLRNCKNFVQAYYIAFFARGGLLNGILKPYFAYYRPSFHPWQHDNSELLKRRKNDFQNGLFADTPVRISD